jgi:hypothetical protein
MAEKRALKAGEIPKLSYLFSAKGAEIPEISINLNAKAPRKTGWSEIIRCLAVRSRAVLV